MESPFHDASDSKVKEHIATGARRSWSALLGGTLLVRFFWNWFSASQEWGLRQNVHVSI